MKNSKEDNNRTKYIKARIDKTQQNSKCRLCGDREETINHIISERSVKEYKTRHVWVEEVVLWELCKKLKFDHTNKWYMYNPESILENETRIPLGLWDTNWSPNLGQTTRPNKNPQKKRICRIVNFAVLADHWVKS